MIDTVTEDELERLLPQAGDEPLLLYFTTSWCGPCRVFGPQLEARVAADPGLPRVLRIDAEKWPQTAARFRVVAFPTLTLVRAGEQLWLRAGALSERELAETLPALGRAARTLGDDPEPSPETDVPDFEPVSAPAAVTVPVFDDPRISVWKGHEKLRPGSVSQLGDDEALRLGFTSDLRLSPSCDLAVLRELPPGAVESVSVQCSDLAPGQVEELAAVRGLASLSLVSTRPLGTDVVGALAGLRGLQLLYVDAPDTDLPAIRRGLPHTMVNFDWTAPRLAASVPRAEPPAVRPPRLPAVRLADPGPDPVIVLAEHPADPAPEAVLGALAEIRDCAAGTACDLGDPAVPDQYRLPGFTELLLVHRGRTIARRDVCGPHHVHELAALAARAGTAGPPGPRPARAERTVTFDLRGADGWLVPPRTPRTDWIALHRRQEGLRIPPGWSLFVRAADTALDTLPHTEIDALEMRLSGEGAPAVTERLGQWPRLERLTVVTAPDDEDLVDRLRDALPGTIVNNEWTHAEMSQSR